MIYFDVLKIDHKQEKTKWKKKEFFKHQAKSHFCSLKNCSKLFQCDNVL